MRITCPTLSINREKPGLWCFFWYPSMDEWLALEDDERQKCTSIYADALNNRNSLLATRVCSITYILSPIDNNAYSFNWTDRIASLVHVINVLWLNIIFIDHWFHVIEPFLNDRMWGFVDASGFNLFRNDGLKFRMTVHETCYLLFADFIVPNECSCDIVDSDDASRSNCLSHFLDSKMIWGITTGCKFSNPPYKLLLFLIR